MTVSELIAQLQRCDQNAKVEVFDSAWGYSAIETFFVSHTPEGTKVKLI